MVRYMHTSSSLHPMLLPMSVLPDRSEVHQFRNHNRRMRIVHLNHYFSCSFTDISALFILLKQCLQTCGNEEILLFQSQFFSRIMIVVRIQYLNDRFRKILLLYRFMVISSVKFIQLEICDRFCIHIRSVFTT